MTTALPAGYPGYFAPQPAPPATTSDDVWAGIYVLTGGAVVTLGLLGWLAVKNAKEHEALRGEIDDQDRRFAAYASDHARLHAALAEAQARVDARLQSQIDALGTRAPVTVYAEPAPALAPAVTYPYASAPYQPAAVTRAATPFPQVELALAPALSRGVSRAPGATLVYGGA